MRTMGILVMLACGLNAAVMLDRIAVVVNRHPIKISDIDRDLRLTDFLNNAPLNLGATEKKASEERLIDQQIIRAELSSGGYRRASDQDADALLEQIRRDRYGDSEARLKQGLGRYGLTEEQLRAQLLWQLTVLRFINDRFRTGVMVSDDDIAKYYEQHRSALTAPLNAVSDSIRTSLEGEQVNQQFEAWLADSRKNAEIDYKTEALQ